VFALSALDALEATVRADRERLAASGILPLQTALAEFLTTEKAKVFLLDPRHDRDSGRKSLRSPGSAG
jgi:hypothetical protein